jgi:hypothetical protein
MSHASLMRLQVRSSTTPDVKMSARLWLRRAKTYRAYRVGGLMRNLPYSSPLDFIFGTTIRRHVMFCLFAPVVNTGSLRLSTSRRKRDGGAHGR